MSISGWYYLHENGDLIYKPEHGGTAADIRDSDFARGLWSVDPSDRESAWSILIEAGASGANKDRVSGLAKKWGCSNDDSEVYAERVGCRLFKDGAAWCATRADFVNLQESPAGFGETALEAMSHLCKELGYQPSKMWGTTFKDLLRASVPSGARP